MNKRQVIRFNMISNVHQACSSFGDVWSAHPGFRKAMGRLEELLEEIRSSAIEQKKPTTGITQTKLKARVALADCLMMVSRGVIAYASEHNNMELIALMKVNRSALLKIRDTEVLPVCMRIHEEVSSRIITEPGLAEYGIDAATLSVLRQKMELYGHHLTSPRQAIGYRRSATLSVDHNIREALSVITLRLDSLMLQLKEVSPEFWFHYNAMRKMVKIGSRQEDKPQETSFENAEVTVMESTEEITPVPVINIIQDTSAETPMEESFFARLGIRFARAEKQSGERCDAANF